MKIFKKATSIILTIALAMTIAPAVFVPAASDDLSSAGSYQLRDTATDAWSLQASTLTISEYNTEYKLYITCDTSAISVTSFSAYSSNSSVVYAEDVYNDGTGYYVSLYKKGVGNANVTVYYNGTSKSFTVNSVAEAITMDTSSITFDSSGYYYYYWYPVNTTDFTLVSGTSSDENVAMVEVYEGEVYVVPYGEGTCTVTVTDDLGRTVEATVTVTKSWVKQDFKNYTYSYYTYGEKYMYVYSKPGAKISVKFGKKTYKKTVNSSGYAKIKVGTNHRYKSKYKVTAKYEGFTYTFKEKTTTASYAKTSYSYLSYSSYVFPAVVYNVHKGDTVYFKCGGKTYSKVIKKDATTKSLDFKLKDNLGSYSSFTITIKNKYNQKLYTETLYWN